MYSRDEEIMMHLLAYNQQHNKFSPFAACLADAEGKILSYGCGYNPNNPAHHAETEAIHRCAKEHSRVKWRELSMFTTGEPCIMCASACCWVNVKRIVYASDIPFIFNLWKEEANMRCIDVINASPNKPELVEHVCEAQSNKMFESYKIIYEQMTIKNTYS